MASERINRVTNTSSLAQGIHGLADVTQYVAHATVEGMADQRQIEILFVAEVIKPPPASRQRQPPLPSWRRRRNLSGQTRNGQYKHTPSRGIRWSAHGHHHLPT